MITKKNLRKIFIIILACFFLLSNTTASSENKTAEIREEIADLKVENAQIQAQIDAIQAQYDETASQIQILVAQKEALDQQIALLDAQIFNIKEQIRLYGQFIADCQDSLEAAQIRLTSLNQQYLERIRAMEEMGEVTYWQVIFQSSSFTDMLDRMNIVDEIAAADQQRLIDIQVAAATVEEYQRQLTEEMADLEDAMLQLADTEAELAIKRTESDALLRDLGIEQETFQDLLDESEALQDALMREIAQKQRELQAAEYEEELVRLALRGENPPSNATWVTPVSGYTITSPFGMRIHPIRKTSAMHNGIDMACSTGTPIYATRAGTVTAASYQAGGAGYYVSISHGDGFASIYMHMTRYVVSKGQTVSQGQLIGYVGSTGLSTGPHLHFGISYGGTYVNPMAYL